jgi:long-chain acyl-CoA synthetase
MAYPSLTNCFLDALDRFPNPRAMLYKAGGRWEAISSEELLGRVAGLARALAAMGVKPGDRVGLLSTNRPEWHITDLAVMGLGGATVPLYFNEAPERIAYILNDSGARIVVAAGAAQVERLVSCRERLESIEQIIVAAAPANAPEELLRLESLIGTPTAEVVAEYRRRAAEVSPDDLATIIYTSGTTGRPKGVMLVHANLSSNVADTLSEADYRRTDVGLSLLPISHVYERMVDYTYLFHGITVAYVERMEDAAQALVEVRPTIVAAVPRFFEKIYAAVMEEGGRAAGTKRRLFDWAMRVAERAIPWRARGEAAPAGLRLAWRLADAVVYRKIRARLGGRIRRLNSGGAPLAKELAEFFWAVGVPVYAGYGLTETSPVVSTETEKARKVGTVGRPIPNVEVRIADDGEILVRGPCVMRGYYHLPEETRETFTADGWLRTGDIGHLDEDGFLAVTDRKKDLLKTAGGKFVAPQPIENRLKSSPFISNAVVLGDRRKFVAALIVPNFANVAAHAREAGVAVSSPAEMAAHPWVRELIAGEVERLTRGFAQWEKIKRFGLLDRDFTFEQGEMTFTLKLKRRVVEQRYQEEIARLYADVEEPRPLGHA